MMNTKFLTKSFWRNKIGEEFFLFLNHAKNYVSAGLFDRSISIITVPIFTRLLIPSDYGILSILTSFMAIFGIVYGLAIRGSVTRYYYEAKDDFNEFLGGNLILLFCWSILLSIVLSFGVNYIQMLFSIPKKIIYIGIVIVFFQMFFSIYESYLNAVKNSKKILKISMFNRLLSVAISIPLILLLPDEKYFGKAYAMLVLAIIVGGYSVIKLLSISKLVIRRKHVKYSLLFSLPIIFHFVSQYILNSFDQVMINKMVGSKETGLYSLAYSVGTFQNMIVMGMLRAWTPEFYGFLNTKNYIKIDKLASKFAKIIYITAFAIILFARELVMILADSKYHEALSIVPAIVLSYVMFFLYTMYVNFSFYHKKTHFVALFTIIAGVINVSLNLWLIPIWGYKVAAWTTFISYGSLFLLHYLNVKYIIKPEWFTSLKVLLPNFFILIFFILSFNYVSDYVANMYILLMIKILFLFILISFFFGRNFFNKEKR